MNAENQRPEVVEGEVVDLDALLDQTPPQHLPAVRARCACGKDGTPEAHGAIPHPSEDRMLRPLPCHEVEAIKARVAFGRLPRWRRLRARLQGHTPEGWRP